MRLCNYKCPLKTKTGVRKNKTRYKMTKFFCSICGGDGDGKSPWEKMILICINSWDKDPNPKVSD